MTGTGFGKRMHPESYWHLVHFYAIETGVVDRRPRDMIRHPGTDTVLFLPLGSIEQMKDDNDARVRLEDWGKGH